MTWADDNGLRNSETRVPALVWVDIETTGLMPGDDVILELGMVLTDIEGDVIGEPFCSIVRSVSNTELGVMLSVKRREIVRAMHENSGLLKDYLAATDAPNEVDVSISAVEWLQNLVRNLTGKNEATKQLHFAGSSVGFDKAFLEEHIDSIPMHLHYRVVDVSTIKVLCQQLNPELYSRMDGQVPSRKLHRPLDDIVDSIHEYQWYVQEFLFAEGWDV